MSGYHTNFPFPPPSNFPPPPSPHLRLIMGLTRTLFFQTCALSFAGGCFTEYILNNSQTYDTWRAREHKVAVERMARERRIMKDLVYDKVDREMGNNSNDGNEWGI